MTTRRMRFVHANLAWMLGVVLVLAAVGSVSLDLFFSASLVGFLVITELTAPMAVKPAWRRRLRWLLVLGLLGFAVIVVRRVLSVLPPGVL